ncbi:MAG: hypothetical protein M4579_002396 [Chaenotheca gracillima]|nr:MAG: hypothetical protein M4579_002396 [Chaenotheca gracillima]
MASNNDIILYTYPFSPFGRRVVWYLTLRGLPYTQCLQPHVLPREDVNALGISYRRIPLCAIGGDVYLDSRLIIDTLEKKFPDGALGSRKADEIAVEQLLQRWVVDGGVFARAAQLLPPRGEAMTPQFKKDREQFMGRSWKTEDLERGRPEAFIEMQQAFELLETTLLADGRDWVLKTPKPSLADIEVVWVFSWLADMKKTLAPHITEQMFPKVFAYVARFNAALSSAKSSAGKPPSIKGGEALRRIVAAENTTTDMGIDENDPFELKLGQNIEVWPIDSGFSHHDQGRLVGLSRNEVVFETQTKIGEKTVKVHAPRHNFRIKKVTGEAGSKL